MIIANIIGGLGNQMFQYAAAKAVSLRRGVDCCFDISGFKEYSLHNGFELNRIFTCNASIANACDKRKVLGLAANGKIRNILARKKMKVIRPKNLIFEPQFSFWDGIWNVPSECYLSGYWQSEKYFETCRSEIRQSFQFAKDLSGENVQLAALLSEEISVSLHVRRGDYISNSDAKEIHGACSLEYYKSAISYINKKIEDPLFVVFSDDIKWVKENLNIEARHIFVTNNSGVDSYIDMQLMSLCHHHVIANSTFSWWGAWLNPRDSKIVVRPEKWFATNKYDASTICPRDWVSLP